MHKGKNKYSERTRDMEVVKLLLQKLAEEWAKLKPKESVEQEIDESH